MTKFSKTVTVFIPAYNEENSIGPLLAALLKQTGESFVLEKIVVANDASEDSTDMEVLRYTIRYDFVYLVNYWTRQGKAARLNTMYKENESDILVVLDADIVLSNENVLEELVKTFSGPKVGLVGGRSKPTPPENFEQSVANTWEQIWWEARRNINEGSSVHNHHGSISALSKEFAKQVSIPPDLASDDEFLYFECISKGFEFRFNPKAIVFHKSPSSIKEFLKQSSRYLSGKESIESIFGAWVLKHYKVPVKNKLAALLKVFLKHPITSVIASFTQLDLKLRLKLHPKEEFRKSMWQPIKSTK